MSDGPDIVIIGSGIGGGTMAAALAASGRRIVILERGERLADCPEARDDRAIFERGHFRPRRPGSRPAVRRSIRATTTTSAATRSSTARC